MSALVRVRRDGPRGWHWIDRARFDPDIHEIVSDPLDHDGDGKPGGSLPGEQSTAARGARRRRAK